MSFDLGWGEAGNEFAYNCTISVLVNSFIRGFDSFPLLFRETGYGQAHLEYPNPALRVRLRVTKEGHLNPPIRGILSSYLFAYSYFRENFNSASCEQGVEMSA
jgi:hypothetical protein